MADLPPPPRGTSSVKTAKTVGDLLMQSALREQHEHAPFSLAELLLTNSSELCGSIACFGRGRRRVVNHILRRFLGFENGLNLPMVLDDTHRIKPN